MLLHAESVGGEGWQSRKRWSCGQKAGAPDTPEVEAAAVLSTVAAEQKKSQLTEYSPRDGLPYLHRFTQNCLLIC